MINPSLTACALLCASSVVVLALACMVSASAVETRERRMRVRARREVEGWLKRIRHNGEGTPHQ